MRGWLTEGRWGQQPMGGGVSAPARFLNWRCRWWRMAAGGTGGEGALGPGGAGGTEPGRCVGHLWGLWAPALLQDSSGRRPGSLGRAEPWARWQLPAREARGCGGPSSCPVLPPAASLQRAREPSWVVPREGNRKRGRCLLSFPCFNRHVLVCGCFASFRLSTNDWEVISEYDTAGVLALPEACSDSVLTFAVYMRENCCVRVCVCCLFSSVSWHLQSVSLVTNTVVIIMWALKQGIFLNTPRMKPQKYIGKSINKINAQSQVWASSNMQWSSL